jgi:hypothetical protein
MSDFDKPKDAGRLPLRRGDFMAILWAVACCWLAVWGNYLLIATGLTAIYLVLFDLFGVPAIVSAGFWGMRRMGR